jgi:hypothetical protein
VNNLESAKKEVTLQTIADSLQLITKTLGTFATKEELKEFANKKDLEAFATKKDLERFATKKDLEAFATKKELKEELKSFATKSDLKDELKDELKNFATRNELKEEVKNFATKNDLERLASKDDLAKSFSELNDTIDWLAATVKGELTSLESRLSQRIDTLEKKVDYNHTYMVNQLDHILTHYARREEYKYFDGRIKKLERKVFA